jgi:hypothetical protein
MDAKCLLRDDLDEVLPWQCARLCSVSGVVDYLYLLLIKSVLITRANLNAINTTSLSASLPNGTCLMYEQPYIPYLLWR